MFLELLLSVSAAHARGYQDIATTAADTAAYAASLMKPAPRTEAPREAPRPPPNNFECLRSVFAEVDHENVFKIYMHYGLYSSLAYSVDVVEKRKSTDIIRISYFTTSLDHAPINPDFHAQVARALVAFKPKRVWVEYFSRFCY